MSGLMLLEGGGVEDLIGSIRIKETMNEMIEEEGHKLTGAKVIVLG